MARRFQLASVAFTLVFAALCLPCFLTLQVGVPGDGNRDGSAGLSVASARAEPPERRASSHHKIGVLANEGKAKCVAAWTATARYLSRVLEPEVFEIVPLGFEEIEEAVKARAVDFVICNSGLYAHFNARYSACAIATSEKTHGGGASALFGGVVFTRADRSDISRFADLKGMRFAAVDPTSFGGWVTALREFRLAGIDPNRDFRSLIFTRNHDEVVEAVMSGAADAGVVRTLVLEGLASDGKYRLDDFKVVDSDLFPHDHLNFPLFSSTRLYPEWPFAALSHVQKDFEERVAISLFNMPPDEEATRASKCRWLIPMSYYKVIDCFRELQWGTFKQAESGDATMRSLRPAQYDHYNEGRAREFKIGALANEGREKCLSMWTPLADYLSTTLAPWRFEIVPLSFDEIEPAIKQGTVDFVICNSGLYVDYDIKYSVCAIATGERSDKNGSSSLFGGVIFTRADRNDISSFEDLRGKRFAAVDPTSFGGWITACREVRRAGVRPESDFKSLSFTKNHDDVVEAVLSGASDAGVVRTLVLERLASSGKLKIEDLKILPSPDFRYSKETFPFLLSTRLYPEWPFAALAHVSKEVAEKIAISLIGMPGDNVAFKSSRCRWVIPISYYKVVECFQELQWGTYEGYGKLNLLNFVAKYQWPIAFAAVALVLLCTFSAVVASLYRRVSAVRGQLEVELDERRKIEDALLSANEQLKVQLTQIEALRENLQHQAIRDPLTGLFNRRYLQETLQRELSRARRLNFSMGVIMMDIDHFKSVNDSYGHKAGDAVLVALGEMLMGESRCEDIACRYGGEEFVVLLPGGSLDASRNKAESWRRSFENTLISCDGRILRATMSVGVSCYPFHGEDADTLLHKADRALYAAKHAGRNRTELAPDEDMPPEEAAAGSTQGR